MKSKYLWRAVVCTQLLLSGCRFSGQKIEQLTQELDSLRGIAEFQHTKLNSYNHFMDVVNAAFDSIAFQEKILFVSPGENAVSKEDVQYNLARFETVLQMQKQRIEDLEKQLAEEDSTINTSTLALIAHLQEQIEVKNRQIQQFKQELENKHAGMAQLQKQVKSQRSTIDTQEAAITQLGQRSQQQEEALARQDAVLYHGYVLIGSKKELIRKGIITSRGKLLTDAILDKTKFTQIDIRVCQELNFAARKPVILTNMPPSSYQLTASGNKNFTLTINNVTDFWKISSYLVIQTD